MTSPESQIPDRIEAKTDTELAAMNITQLRDESLRLFREHNKLTVQFVAVLLNAIQQRYPGPLEPAIERAAAAARLPSQQVWGILRTDYASPYPASVRDRNIRTLARASDQILAACGQDPGSEEAVLLQLIINRLRDMYKYRDRVTTWRQKAQEQERLGDEEVVRIVGGDSPSARRSWLEPPAAAVPDVAGWECKPDPLAATSVGEFVESLGQLHVWAGEPSLRKLASRSPGTIAHSTFSAMLNDRQKLPSQRTVTLFVRALGCDEEEVQRWVTAWRTLRFQRQRPCARPANETDGTVTALRRPASSQ